MEDVAVTTPAAPTIKDTRAALGMAIILLCLCAAFIVLLIVYAGLRLGSQAWPPPGLPAPPILLPTINTFVVMASSLTMHAATRSLAAKQGHLFSRYLLWTANLGALFLLLQVVLARQAAQLGIVAGDTLYGSLLYTIAGFHAVHLLVGVVAIALLSLYASFRRPSAYLNRARLWGLYWHFIGAIWIVMFVALFVI